MNGSGREFVGKVASNRMQKSVTVLVQRLGWCSKHKGYQKRWTRIMAHDETNECDIGDIVRIMRSRKMSQMKTYTVIETLKKANVYDPVKAAEIVAKRDAERPTDWVATARQRVVLAMEKLQTLRQQYQQELLASSAQAESGKSLS